MFQRFCTIIILFMCTCSWGKGAYKPEWLHAVDVIEKANGLPEFNFHLYGWICKVHSKGSGRCAAGNSAWKLKLPVADGSISGIFINYSTRYGLVYSVDNGEAIWAIAARIVPHRTAPIWTVQVPGLSFATPFLYGDQLIVISSLSVSSISIRSGDWIWRHQWLYEEGQGVATPEVNIDSTTLWFMFGGKDSKPVCFNLEFGYVLNCP